MEKGPAYEDPRNYEEALKALNEAREELITAHDRIAVLEKQNHELQQHNAVLEAEIGNLKRAIFGSKSERYVPDNDGQLSLSLEGTRKGERGTAPQKETVTYQRERTKKDKKKAVRLPLPPHLPRREEVHHPEGFPREGADRIGEEVTEVIEYAPGECYVRKIVRPKYAISEDAGVRVADMPTLPLPKANAGPGFLAQQITSKYRYHMPYYRQAQQFKEREGVDLDRGTMSRWEAGVCDLLAPLMEKQAELAGRTDYIMADETTIRVLDKNKKGKSHRGYYWVYLCPRERIVRFIYHKGRGGCLPWEDLREHQGYLQTDDYGGYNKIGQRPDITHVGCMAHIRRKFEHALDSDREHASYVMERIGELYKVEREARDKGMTSEERLALRKERAEDVFEGLGEWFQQNKDRFLPKSPMGKAIHYGLHQWPKVRHYLRDGRLEIDNNWIENKIRPVALGRKNYLFAGSHKGAERGAMIYSLIGTCVLNDVEPFEWLRDVLERIADHPANRVEELLPQNWTPKKEPAETVG